MSGGSYYVDRGEGNVCKRKINKNKIRNWKH